MNEEQLDGNAADFFFDDDTKKRSPVGRIVTWTVIVGLLVVVGIEMRAKFGYDNSIELIETQLDDRQTNLFLKDARQQIKGGPRFTELFRQQGSPYQFCGVQWFSLFKEYRVVLYCSNEPEPVVLGTQTEIPEPINALLGMLERGETLPEVKDEAKPPQVRGFANNRNPPPPVLNPGFNPLANLFTPRVDPNAPKFTGRVMPATSLAAVMDRDATLPALALTSDQKTTIDDLNSRMGDKLIEAPSDRTGFLKAQAEIHGEKIETLKTTLSSEQFGVLISEYARWQGPFGMREPNVAKKLELRDDQVAELHQVFSQWLDIPSGRRSSLQQSAIAKSLSVLNAQQRKTWDALVGG